MWSNHIREVSAGAACNNSEDGYYAHTENRNALGFPESSQVKGTNWKTPAPLKLIHFLYWRFQQFHFVLTIDLRSVRENTSKKGH